MCGDECLSTSQPCNGTCPENNDRSIFLVSITIHVEIIVIIILPHAMVLALKVEFFAVISVYQKTAGKNIFSPKN